MKVLRTPDERFARLPGYPFAPHYADIGGLRMHYVDEGPREAAPVLLLHGEPTWSYLYRTIIRLLSGAGRRVIAPDLIGFGRSDKPSRRADYSYQRHVDWVAALLDTLGLRNITLVCQDWGGLIGLRVAAEHPARFDRIVAANTGLPTGQTQPTEAFKRWQRYARLMPWLPIGQVVARGCTTPMPREVRAAYDAPFPSPRYQAGAMAFPLLVPTSPDDPAVPANLRAWEALKRWEKPFLTAFSDRDPITSGGEAAFQKLVPGAQGQPHVTIRGAGHFLQEDQGSELARVVLNFIARTTT